MNQDVWVQVLSLLLAFSETLGKSFNLFLLRKIFDAFCLFCWAGSCFPAAVHLYGSQRGRSVDRWLVVKQGSLVFLHLGMRGQTWEFWVRSYNGEHDPVPRSASSISPLNFPPFQHLIFFPIPSLPHRSGQNKQGLFFPPHLQSQNISVFYELDGATRLLKLMSIKYKLHSFPSWWL